MTTLSTHVLDTARGVPAQGIRVTVEAQTADGWRVMAEGVTNHDGRVAALASLPGAGVYRLRFDTGSYQQGFYPEVTVTFRTEEASPHYHVPLLLSPFGYSTYRGS